MFLPVRSFVCLSVCYQTCKHDMQIDANWHKWSTWQVHEMVNLWGQEVKGQGHTRVEDRFGGLAEALFMTTLGGVYILF